MKECRTFTVPFDLLNGLTLLKDELNDKPAVLTLDIAGAFSKRP